MRAFAIVGLALTAGCSNCSRAPGDQTTSDAATSPDAATINVTPVPTETVIKAVNPKHRPPYAGPTGSVEGTINVTGDPASDNDISSASFAQCPDGVKTYGKAFREGTPTEPRGRRWLADAVVVVTGFTEMYVPEKDEAEQVTIEGCGFSKRTITMTFGQRLEVKNLTNEFWAPAFEPTQTTVLMMAPPRGDAIKLYPKQPGRYRLVDHDRKYAVADVFVLLQPLHTVSALEGKYRIDGLPVGKVKIHTWHPSLKLAAASADLDVQSGVIHHVDLTLDPPPPHDAGTPHVDPHSDAGESYPIVH